MIGNNQDEDAFSSGEIDLKSIIYLLLRNKFLIISITTLSILIGIFYAISLKRTWAGDFQIVLKREKGELDASNSSNIIGAINPMTAVGGLNTQIEILKSPSVLMPIFEFVKRNYRDKGGNIDELSYKKWFNQSFNIKLARRTEVLDVEYRDKNKELILPVLKKISKTYQQYSGNEKLISLNSGLNYLDEQIKIYKRKQLNSLEELQDFAYKNDLSTTKVNIDGTQSELNVESVRVIEANKIRTINKYLEKIEEISNNPESLIYFDTIFPDFLTNQTRISTQEINNQLSKAKATYKPGYKEISRLENQLKIYSPLLKKELVNFLTSKKYEAEAKLASSKRDKKTIAKYKQLLSNSAIDEKTLNGLVSEKRSLALQKAKTTDPWDLITEPTLTKYPVAPNRKRITLAAGILGGVFSIIIASLYELIKGNIHREKDFEKVLNFPRIKVLDSSQKQLWIKSIELLARSTIFSKKINYALLNIGEIEDKLLEEFKAAIKNSFLNFNLSYPLNLKDGLECDNIIFIVQLGKVTYNDLALMREDLNLQNHNVKGIIYLK